MASGLCRSIAESAGQSQVMPARSPLGEWDRLVVMWSKVVQVEEGDSVNRISVSLSWSV